MINELIQNRKQKHLQANNGNYPLVTKDQNLDFGIQSLLSLKDWKNPVVSLHPEDLTTNLYTVQGRIKNLRKTGGLTFIKIEDHHSLLQVILARKVLGEEKYNLVSNFDLGDIIEVTGQICQTVAGETSLLLREPLKLLSKALLPPPEKWVGIANKETIYKQRYLDLMSNPDSRQRFKDRAKIIRAIRNYLDGLQFVEVETSMLHSLISGANANPFTTYHHAADKDLYLRIAPELNLKRLLVGGMDRVYEIGKSFRNEGISSRHNPEFTMLEFYQSYASFDDLIIHCQNLLRLCFNELETNEWDCPVDFTEFKQLTMLKAVQNAAYYRLSITLPDSLEFSERIDFKSLSSDKILRDSLIILTSEKSFGEKLFQLFELLAEPYLSCDYRTLDGFKSIPVLITQYPVEICPLARKSDADSRFCDRFELYLNGIEVANGYQELNDPEEQKKRFEEQLATNKKDPMDLDSDYIEALSYGMPPAIGFGLGVDRLTMILTDASSIKDVILFPAV